MANAAQAGQAPSWDWAAHLVFGLSFGLYPAIAARLEKSGSAR